jgi:2-polyprenyl-3-methyl-5-hydroxy-6-metoxy-1,4-benzoquinol methylase
MLKKFIKRCIAWYSVRRYNIRWAGRDTPTLAHPRSQIATLEQFREPDFARLAQPLDIGKRIHRKDWEWVYIVRSLEKNGMLTSGRSALGFGCGNEPMPRALASYGVNIIATDLPDNEAMARGWDSMAIQSDLANLRTAFLDMNAIDDRYLKGEFDFVWSSCSLEHLGTLDKGIEFVVNSLKCIKPGGLAVHTTEFNLTSNRYTVRSGPIVAYRERDILRLRDLVSRNGGTMEVTFGAGDGLSMDTVDFDTTTRDPHIYLLLGTLLLTSIGMTIRRNS